MGYGVRSIWRGKLYNVERMAENWGKEGTRKVGKGREGGGEKSGMREGKKGGMMGGGRGEKGKVRGTDPD